MQANGTATLKRVNSNKEFEQLYINVRRKEQRIYTDEEVLQLPDISPSHIHYQEWGIRKRSAERLVAYLNKKEKPLNILEIGCGNGWLAAKLADIKNSTVLALDINQVEIEQAERVFKKDNLRFGQYAFEPEKVAFTKFDVIVFAASIQYFAPLKNMLQKALCCLADDGEIHIVDTNFYTASTVKNARQRTLDYYDWLDCPQMAAYYYHHQLNELFDFNHHVLSDPGSLLHKITKSSPFYWVKIKK